MESPRHNFESVQDGTQGGHTGRTQGTPHVETEQSLRKEVAGAAKQHQRRAQQTESQTFARTLDYPGDQHTNKRKQSTAREGALEGTQDNNDQHTPRA